MVNPPIAASGSKEGAGSTHLGTVNNTAIAAVTNIRYFNENVFI